ncbi:MAG: glycosyltransferase family 2 protein [Leptolyngbyaceae cyanobacterium MO_188.B28]|nr:glycosyltransferase family 2 protein [Leptolyngbyaceae cyanobacterium MO_188.B28]
MKLSIVTTMYCSTPYLQEFYDRIKAEAETVTDDYEIIFVNDGSPDNSLETAVSLYKIDPKVRVLDLSRNFGHHKAMMTGLAHARGKLVFLIDCDLEEDPDLLGLFYQKRIELNCDVVYGVQKNRKGSWIEQITGEIYYWLLRKLSGINFPKNVITARLMTRRYVKSLLRHRERELTIAALWHITGYEQFPIYITKYSKGKTTYNFFKKLSVFVNSIVSFSDRPLMIIFYTGLIISIISAFFIIDILIQKLVFNIGLVGWPSLIVSIWFVGGLIICFLGIIGIYISKIFIETKRRPYSIIREIYQYPSFPNRHE